MRNRAGLIETIKEIERRNNDFDGVRRERIRAVEALTGRPLIVYASAFLNRGKVQASGGEVGIDGNDKLAFDEVITGLDRKVGLDVLMHSPGGQPEAAEAIVELLRSEFPSLRFFVPDQAKSAATMMCCAGDEILMDVRSELGPIDPQMVIPRGDGQIVFAPAQGIVDQFDRAKESLSKNPEYLPAWLPILQPLSPALLSQCEDADRLSRSLVSSWLIRYMFHDVDRAKERADAAVAFLADAKVHLSHGRRITIDQLQLYGMKVIDLRDNPQLREAVWALYHAITWTFDRTSAFKLTENGHGGAFIRQVITQTIQLPVGLPIPGQPPSTSTPAKGKPKRRRR
ncbi:MAG: hypothetical protein A2Y93_17555 [Chloroflexi bacterium RBG_13_68_17]|nr:MAG: hypothetical protein A2Y93_17555 [Chloroflexi bacterium RBG_13_68_17]